MDPRDHTHSHDDGGHQQTRTQPIQARAVRELKVEDALLYLDQVKMEFSDKPHIYNEFLEIMKNFKAQSINTPGVIERVKNLFRGYNKLILGFNTFLPEGEGYKIELTPEEQEYPHPIHHMPHHATTGPRMGMGVMGSASGAGAGTSQGALSAGPATGGGIAHAAGPNAATTPTAAGGGGGNLASAGGPQGAPAGSGYKPPQQMQQQHAISYVTTIRNRFANEPETYRAFLKILHTYQKEQKGIKDVLEQVSQLFADHSDLLMEFTYFLPDAVQEQAKERLHRAARESELRREAENKRRLALQQHQEQLRLQQSHQLGAGIPIIGGGTVGLATGNTAVSAATLLPPGGAAPTGTGSAQKRPRAEKETGKAQVATAEAPAAKVTKTATTGASTAKPKVPRSRRVSGDGTGPVMSSKEAAAAAAAAAIGAANAAAAAAAAANAAAAASAAAAGHAAPAAASAAPPAATVATTAASGAGASTASANGSTSAQQSGSSGPAGHGTQAPAPVPVPAPAPPPPPMNIPGMEIKAGPPHISVSEERHMFDQIKDLLTAVSRDSWNEFVKLLDMFGNEALERKDLLRMSQDLLGPANIDVYEEFKRLLNGRNDYEAHAQDMWYATPLSEVDWTSHRKCTPSYRALPKNYPKPTCMERSPEEASVLNDEWVSIPIGSEESWTFKHMRKNQYEDALFKCEDERFEIDMIIDSNVSTIRALEPLAAEIAQLRVLDEEGAGGAASGSGGQGGAPRFCLQLERRGLSTTHLSSIARLYGEHGTEILELLRKNPAGSIPVILKRLKQKDVEWRKARQEFNIQWKETVIRNFDKSNDHRSFYFKQQDKRICTTRHLVSEIKGITEAAMLGPGAPGGVLGGGLGNSLVSGSGLAHPSGVAAYATAPGLGYLSGTSAGAVGGATLGLRPGAAAGGPLAGLNAAPDSATSTYAAMQASEELKQPGVARSVSPALTPYLAGMHPQLSLSYSSAHFTVHRDMLRLFSHAAEVTLQSPNDKERLSALWRDLLRTLFNIPSNFFQASSDASVAPLLVGNGASGHGRAGMAPVPDVSEAWPTGMQVLTSFGQGTIRAFRAADGLYEVELPFGVGFLSPTAILGAEELPLPALQAIGVSVDAATGAEVIFNGSVSPSRGPTPPAIVRDPSKLFYGTQMCYIFLRLHHIIYSRLAIARQLSHAETVNATAAHPLTLTDASDDEGEDTATPAGSGSKAGGGGSRSSQAQAKSGRTSSSSSSGAASSSRKRGKGGGSSGNGARKTNRYNSFLGQLFGLLDGSLDSSRYEECCRQLLGNKAYILYTLDKVIHQAIKCMQAMANDDSINKLVGLFVYHRSRGTRLAGPGQGALGVDADLYLAHVSQTLSNTMEDIYRLQVLVHNDLGDSDTEVACQFLGTPGATATTSEGGAKAPQLVLADEEEEMEVDGPAVVNAAEIAVRPSAGGAPLAASTGPGLPATVAAPVSASVAIAAGPPAPGAASIVLANPAAAAVLTTGAVISAAPAAPPAPPAPTAPVAPTAIVASVTVPAVAVVATASTENATESNSASAAPVAALSSSSLAGSSSSLATAMEVSVEADPSVLPPSGPESNSIQSIPESLVAASFTTGPSQVAAPVAATNSTPATGGDQSAQMATQLQHAGVLRDLPPPPLPQHVLPGAASISPPAPPGPLLARSYVAVGPDGNLVMLGGAPTSDLLVGSADGAVASVATMATAYSGSLPAVAYDSAALVPPEGGFVSAHQYGQPVSAFGALGSVALAVPASAGWSAPGDYQSFAAAYASTSSLSTTESVATSSTPSQVTLGSDTIVMGGGITGAVVGGGLGSEGLGTGVSPALGLGLPVAGQEATSHTPSIGTVGTGPAIGYWPQQQQQQEPQAEGQAGESAMQVDAGASTEH